MRVLYYILNISCLVLAISCDSNKNRDSLFIEPTRPEDAVKVVEENNYDVIIANNGTYLPGKQNWKKTSYYDINENLLQEVTYVGQEICDFDGKPSISSSYYYISIYDYKYENDTLISVRDFRYSEKLDGERILHSDTQLTIYRDSKGKIIRTETNTGEIIEISFEDQQISGPANFYYDSDDRLVRIQQGQVEKRYNYIGDNNSYTVFYSYSAGSGYKHVCHELYENGLKISSITKVFADDGAQLNSIVEFQYVYNRDGQLIKQIMNEANRNFGWSELDDDGDLVDDYYEKYPLLARVQRVTEWEYNNYGDCMKKIEYARNPELDDFGRVKIANGVYEYQGYPNSPINETEYIYSYADSNDWTTRIKLTKSLFVDRSITTRTVHDIREMSDNDDYKSFEDMRFPIIGTID